MTEDLKKEVEKLRESEGAGGWADDYGTRIKEEHELRKRDVESAIAARDRATAHAAESMQMNRATQKRAEESHDIYVRDVARGVELRELSFSREEERLALTRDEVSAFKRIADALEKLTGAPK